MTESAPPWKTVYSRTEVASAHRFAGRAILGGVFLAALGVLTDARPTYWVLFLVFAGLTCVIFSRRMNVRVSTSVSGIHVVNMWNSYTVPWGEVENILASTEPILRVSKSGEIVPPPLTWEHIVQNDPRMIIVSPERGPERIVEMMILRRTGPRHLFIDARDRESWDSLSTGWSWHQENFSRPLDFGYFNPPTD